MVVAVAVYLQGVVAEVALPEEEEDFQAEEAAPPVRVPGVR